MLTISISVLSFRLFILRLQYVTSCSFSQPHSRHIPSPSNIFIPSFHYFLKIYFFICSLSFFVIFYICVSLVLSGLLSVYFFYILFFLAISFCYTYSNLYIHKKVLFFFNVWNLPILTFIFYPVTPSPFLLCHKFALRAHMPLGCFSRHARPTRNALSSIECSTVQKTDCIITLVAN